jgi:hypothetical protein
MATEKVCTKMMDLREATACLDEYCISLANICGMIKPAVAKGELTEAIGKLNTSLIETLDAQIKEAVVLSIMIQEEMTITDSTQKFYSTGGDDDPANYRFFGAINAGGISSIFIANDSGGIEVDDLQYGLSATSSVPEPTTWAMLLVGFGAIGFMLRGSPVSKEGPFTTRGGVFFGLFCLSFAKMRSAISISIKIGTGTGIALEGSC